MENMTSDMSSLDPTFKPLGQFHMNIKCQILNVRQHLFVLCLDIKHQITFVGYYQQAIKPTSTQVHEVL